MFLLSLGGYPIINCCSINNQMRLFFKTLIILLTVSLPVMAQEDSTESYRDAYQKDKTLTLIYTKIHNSERSSEFFAGFSTYISNHRVTANIRTLNFNIRGENQYEEILRRFKIAARSPIIRLLSTALIATDSEGHRLFCDTDTLVPERASMLSVSMLGEKLPYNPGISTISVNLFFKENFKLGMKLFPKTKDVIVITDESQYGDIEMRIAREQLSVNTEGVKIHFLKASNSHFRDFVDQINNFPDNTFIIISSWQIDSYGNYHTNSTRESFLGDISKFPVFSIQNLLLGSGVLGGYTTSTWDIGYRAAKIASELRPGEIVSDTMKDSRLILDFNVLTRFGLGINNAPKNSEFINRPKTIYEAYTLEFQFLIAFFSLLLLSSLIFAVYTVRYKKSLRENRQLREENLRQKQMLEQYLKIESDNRQTSLPVKEKRKETPAGAGADTESEKNDSKKPLVLIAEDLECNYILLKVILSKWYEVIWAENGKRAVDMYKTYNPDLILMDIKMPVMDGLTATEEIRKISPSVPIVAQTANAFEFQHIQAINAGCNEVITKPVDINNMLQTIKKHLENSQYKSDGRS